MEICSPVENGTNVPSELDCSSLWHPQLLVQDRQIKGQTLPEGRTRLGFHI